MGVERFCRHGHWTCSGVQSTQAACPPSRVLEWGNRFEGKESVCIPDSHTRSFRFKLGPAHATLAAESKDTPKLSDESPENFVNALQIR